MLIVPGRCPAPAGSNREIQLTRVLVERSNENVTEVGWRKAGRTIKNRDVLAILIDVLEGIVCAINVLLSVFPGFTKRALVKLIGSGDIHLLSAEA
jgi:hypothetical protein